MNIETQVALGKQRIISWMHGTYPQPQASLKGLMPGKIFTLGSIFASQSNLIASWFVLLHHDSPTRPSC